MREHNAELQETFPLPKWDAKKHIQFMNDMKIDYSILFLPAPQPYFGDSKESVDMVRKLNEISAKVRDKIHHGHGRVSALHAQSFFVPVCLHFALVRLHSRLHSTKIDEEPKKLALPKKRLDERVEYGNFVLFGHCR